MKKLLSSVLALTMVLSAVSTAHAAAPKNRVAQLMLELNDTNQDIDKVTAQLDQARGRRNAALWIGIPATLLSGAWGLLQGFGSMMSDSPSAGEEGNRAALKTLGISAVIGAGTSYFVHIKNEDIGVLLLKLKELKAKNKKTELALAALGEQ